MTTELYQQFAQLPPPQQQKVAEYIRFLQWQAEQSALPTQPNWSFSFIETFRHASVYASQAPAGLDVQVQEASVGGESRPALWAHPPVVGQGMIEYHVPIPDHLQQVQLRVAVGIRDGAKIASDTLVAFSLRVNGLRVWGTQTNQQKWHMVTIPLDVPRGDVSRIIFATETLNRHEWTWAVWGEPELVGYQP